MRNFLRISAVLTGMAVLLLYVSCSREDIRISVAAEQDEIIQSDQEEASVIEEILDEVLMDLEDLDFLKSADICPVISVDRPDSTRYPKIITKDFGDSCITDWGTVKSGKIIIAIDGPWLVEGSTRLVTFENYTHRGIAISGEKEIICKGLNENGFPVHAIKGKILLEKPNGITVEREIHKRRILIAGLADNSVPREWLVKGFVIVNRSDGVSFEMQITEPLYRIQGCRWFQSGMKALTFSMTDEAGNSAERVVYVDYSYQEEDNECDRYALRWIDDGEQEVIKLGK